jgi:hypothetical protein
MSSNNSCWLPLGLCALVLVFLMCSSGSSTAVQLQQKNDGSSGNMADDRGSQPPRGQKKTNTSEQGKKERKQIRNKVLTAHLDNYSSGFARLGKKTDDKGKAYYPQIQHYFKTNENSYESIVQKREKKKSDPTKTSIAQAIDEAEQQ